MVNKALLEALDSYIEAVYVEVDFSRLEGAGHSGGRGRLAAPLKARAREDVSLESSVPADAALEWQPLAQAPLPAVTGAMPALDERLADLDASFASTVLRLIDERGLDDVEVYKRANMSRQLFAKIRKDDNYRPTKKTACALAFALGLSYEDALALLSRAGFALSHSSKFDVIVEFFLMNGIHDIYQVNEALYAYDQPILG